MDADFQNMKPPKKRAPWTRAFLDQQKKLHPERSPAGGVKARSTPEAIRMAIYNAIKVLFLERHQLCSIDSEGKGQRCNDWTTEVHHRRGRAGWLLIDVRYWTATCTRHHRWIHDNPAAATKLGLLEKR